MLTAELEGFINKGDFLIIFFEMAKEAFKEGITWGSKG